MEVEKVQEQTKEGEDVKAQRKQAKGNNRR